MDIDRNLQPYPLSFDDFAAPPTAQRSTPTLFVTPRSYVGIDKCPTTKET
jgi:hypothetical protein